MVLLIGAEVLYLPGGSWGVGNLGDKWLLFPATVLSL